MPDKDILEEAKEKQLKAREVVSNMCNGDGKWLMQIPANPKQDSDILISDALNTIDELIFEVERLRSIVTTYDIVEIDFLSRQIDDLTKELEEVKKNEDFYQEMASQYKEERDELREKVVLKKPTPDQLQYLKDIIEWEKTSSQLNVRLP